MHACLGVQEERRNDNPYYLQLLLFPIKMVVKSKISDALTPCKTTVGDFFYMHKYLIYTLKCVNIRITNNLRNYDVQINTQYTHKRS